MTDISTRAHIEILIDEFYKKVIADPVIGFIFTDVVKLSWEKHIPVMYSFWESMLLGENTYKGNPMVKHIELDKLVTLTPEHFNTLTPYTLTHQTSPKSDIIGSRPAIISSRLTINGSRQAISHSRLAINGSRQGISRSHLPINHSRKA